MSAYQTGTATDLDVTPANLRGSGVSIIRRTEGHSYPKNGNAHNPTPRYNWLVMANGKIVDQSARMANVLETAAEVAAELAANR